MHLNEIIKRAFVMHDINEFIKKDKLLLNEHNDVYAGYNLTPFVVKE
jgi:hypothetical protein